MGALVWLASFPKSGNTWTRNFLHNLLDPVSGNGEEAGEAHGEITTTDINAMQRKTTWDSAWMWYRSFLNDRKFDDCTEKEIAEARMQANEMMAGVAADGLLFVKTHNAMMADHGGIPMINPKVTAGAVYIIRNPLDVAVSYSHHLNLDLDRTIRLMAKRGKKVKKSERMAYELQGSWSEHVHSWTRRPDPSLHIMRYEDMQESPLETFDALTKFLRISCAPQQVAEAVAASSFSKLKEQEEREGFKEKPERAKQFFRQGRAGEWREVLSKSQVEAIVRQHGEQMARFGYLPDQYA